MIDGHDDRSGRELRLLLLVIAVAVAVLLVLARFRFPEAEIASAAPTPNPLERIATRAPFDDLSNAVADTAARLMPYVTVVEFAPPPERADKRTEKKAGRGMAPRRYVTGLRVRSDLVLAHAPAGLTPVLTGGATVLAADPERELVLIATIPASRDGSASGIDLSSSSSSTGFAGSTYVLVVEAGAVGPAARPAFLSRTSPAPVDHWNTALLRVSGDPQAAAGTVIFTLDGKLVGLAVPHADGLVIADAAAIDRAVTELAGGKQ